MSEPTITTSEPGNIAAPAPKSNVALIYGLIAGAAAIVFTTILYLGGLDLYTSLLAYLSFLIPPVVAFLGGQKQKQLQGGYISFKEALKVVFTIFLVYIVLNSLFNHILLNMIDVPFREALMQDAGIKMEKFLTKMGAKQEDIDKALTEMANPENFAFKKVFLAMLMAAIGWFIVSLIISAIIKKKKPEFEENQL